MKILLIIFLVLKVSHRVQSQTRLVVNTTCLELAKPSNQQLRLSCSNPSDYHCLLDESYTLEFEACRDWKWIPEGKCAYFNTYGRGNIDERNCIQKTNLTCSHGTIQFSSATNTKYTACYVKKEISTSLPYTTSPSGTQSNEGNATSVSTSSDKQDERSGHALPIIFGIIAPFVSIAVIYSICMHLKYVPLYRKAYPIESQELSDSMRNEDIVEQQPFLRNEVENTPESQPTMTHEDENITGARRNDAGNVEKQPVLRIKLKDTSTLESPPTTRHEDGNISEARRSDMNESDLSDHFEDALSSPTIKEQRNSEVSTGNKKCNKDQKGDKDELRTKEVNSDTCKSAEDISENLKEGGSTADVQSKELDEETSAENASGLCIVSDKSDNKEGDKEEPTDVFDDTVESLQRIAHPTDEQDRELCIELFNLLDTKGLKLSQEVMAAIITRKTEKSVKILKDQGKNRLTEVLSEEHHRILESEKGCDTSFHVTYGLHKIFLDEEQSPKSGWGNPIRGTDIGIGDDVERLNRIQTIVCGISDPVTVSVESYIKLLDIMIESLTRLYPGAEFKEDYKLLSYKLESIKNPNLTQAVLKKITDIVKKIW